MLSYLKKEIIDVNKLQIRLKIMENVLAFKRQSLMQAANRYNIFRLVKQNKKNYSRPEFIISKFKIKISIKLRSRLIKFANRLTGFGDSYQTRII